MIFPTLMNENEINANKKIGLILATKWICKQQDFSFDNL